MKIFSPIIIPHTKYGSARSKVSPMIDGPKSISWNINEKDYWGAPVLRLSIRNLQDDQVESRSVYTNLFDKSRPLALLRCIYWNGRAVRDQIHYKNPVDLTIQARFVVLHKQAVRSWLTVLDGLSLSIHTKYEADPLQPIKDLRIELDYATWIFERRWQSRDPDYDQLEQKWNLVWHRMGGRMSNPVHPDEIEENFSPRVVTPSYDLQSYKSPFPGLQ